MLRIKFLHNLLLLCLLLVMAVPAYLLLVVHPSYQDLLVSQAEAQAVRSVNSLMRSLGLENRPLIRDRFPDTLEVQLIPFRNDNHLLKLRFFSVNGEILYSTEVGEIGTVNSKDYFLNTVMQGGVYSRMVQKDHTTAEGVLSTLDVVETYVPFMLDGSFGGAVEAYYDITQSAQQLKNFTLHAVVTLVGTSLLFLALIALALARAARSLQQRDAAEKARELIQQDLEASQRELINITENTSVGIFRCDTDGRLLWLNDLAGFFMPVLQKGEVPDWAKACHPDDVERVVAGWERTIARNKRFKDEFRMFVAGSPLWFQGEVTPEYDMQEQIIGFVGTLSDISELKSMDAQIKEAQVALMQQEKMASIGQLAAGVAHEINNPMGFVNSNLATLSKYTKSLIRFIAAQGELAAGSGDAAGRDVIDRLRKELQIDFILEDIDSLLEESLDGVNRIQKIVLTLKDFARVDQHNMCPEDLNECLDTTLSLLGGEIPGGVVIEKSYSQLPLLNCFAQDLNQSFMNILRNALLAVGEEGVVRIKTRADEQNIYVEISDNGCGIAEQHLSRIFDPFYTLRPVGEGTGLGLSFAHDTIINHSGEVSVISQPGQGSTFTITLPINRQSDSA